MHTYTIKYGTHSITLQDIASADALLRLLVRTRECLTVFLSASSSCGYRCFECEIRIPNYRYTYQYELIWMHHKFTNMSMNDLFAILAIGMTMGQDHLYQQLPCGTKNKAEED